MRNLEAVGPLKPEYIDADGRTIHLWRAGHGAPAVLLHGFSDDGACWVSTAPIFVERGMEVVAPDARAHGATPLCRGDEFTAAGRLSDTEAMLEALGLTTVLAVGHSMGAVTAMQLAAHGDRVSSAVLIDPPLFGIDLDPTRDQVNLFEPWIDEVAALAPGALAARCRRESPNWTEDEVAAWVSSKRSLDRELFDRRQSWHGESWRTTIEAIECPLLVVAGEVELGSAVDADAGAWLAAEPSVEFTRIAGAGHSVHRDRREAFSSLVGDFLDRLG